MTSILLEADALEFLRRQHEPFDAIYSVFGALWFTEPHLMLPAVRTRLAPAGLLVFSHRPPNDGRYDRQAALISPGAGHDPFVIQRWDYTPDAWTQLLLGHGFTEPSARVLCRPDGRQGVGTLVVRAGTPRAS